MNSLTLALFGGLVVWLTTLIIVEGVVFDGVRASIKRSSWIPSKLKYLVTCHLCAGVWVGFGIAALLDGPLTSSNPVVAVLMNGLLYKAVGHLILQVAAWAEKQVERSKLLNANVEEHHKWMRSTNSELQLRPTGQAMREAA